MMEAGDFSVTVTNPKGCSGSSNMYKYPPLHVDDVYSQSIKLFPNPATTHLNIAAPVEIRAQITGVDGKKLIQSNSKKIDIGALPAGIYSVKIFDADGVLLTIQKLVKIIE